jgi:hypothetical protein
MSWQRKQYEQTGGRFRKIRRGEKDWSRNDKEAIPNSEKDHMKALTSETLRRNIPDEIDRDFYTEIGGEG